jgi:hypothetical protein
MIHAITGDAGKRLIPSRVRLLGRDDVGSEVF